MSPDPFDFLKMVQIGEPVEGTPQWVSQTDFGWNLQGKLGRVTSRSYDATGTQTGGSDTVYAYAPSGDRVSSQTEEWAHVEVYGGQFEDRVRETTTTYLVDPDNFTGYSQVLKELTSTTTTIGSNISHNTSEVTSTLGHDVVAQWINGHVAPLTEVSYGPPMGMYFNGTASLLYDGHGSTRQLSVLPYNSSQAAPASWVIQGYVYDAYGQMLGGSAGGAFTNLLYSGEQFDQRAAMQYLRARYYDVGGGTFVGLDPYSGDKYNPQSYHKYLYTHANPTNGLDPSGRNLVSTLATASIATAAIGTIGGATVGILNAGVGIARGQMDLQSAARTFTKFTLLGAGAGAGAAIFMLQLGLFHADAAATIYAIEIGAAGSAIYAQGPEGVSSALVRNVFQHTDGTIKKYRNEIVSAAQNEGIPPDLLAAVLLAELNDYGIKDFLGDDITLWDPEEHSIGIAQLRIDNVRNWYLQVPEFGNLPPGQVPASKIRAALETDESAIELLAQAIRRTAEMGPAFNSPIIGFAKDQAIDFSQWDSLTIGRRSAIAGYFGNAKDDLQGRLVMKGELQADVTYRQVLARDLLQ